MRRKDSIKSNSWLVFSIVDNFLSSLELLHSGGEWKREVKMESTSRKAMSDSLHFEKWLPGQPNTQVKSIPSVLHVFQVSHFAFPLF